MKTIKMIKKKEYEFRVQGRILKWTLPSEYIADRWEIIPSISLVHSSTFLVIKFAWICFELSFIVFILRFYKMIEEK